MPLTIKVEMNDLSQTEHSSGLLKQEHNLQEKDVMMREPFIISFSFFLSIFFIFSFLSFFRLSISLFYAYFFYAYTCLYLDVNIRNFCLFFWANRNSRCIRQIFKPRTITVVGTIQSELSF